MVVNLQNIECILTKQFGSSEQLKSSYVKAAFIAYFTYHAEQSLCSHSENHAHWCLFACLTQWKAEETHTTHVPKNLMKYAVYLQKESLLWSQLLFNFWYKLFVHLQIFVWSFMWKTAAWNVHQTFCQLGNRTDDDIVLPLTWHWIEAEWVCSGLLCFCVPSISNWKWKCSLAAISTNTIVCYLELLIPDRLPE